MNLLILSSVDLTSAGKATIYAEDRRFKHLTSILKVDAGAQLKVGLLGGLIGLGKICFASAQKFEIEYELTEPPPEPLPVTLIIALPRPKVVLRVLQSAATLGVKQIHLVNAYKVEKAFWSCEQLTEKSINKSLLLGLEQARDTALPNVHLERRLKPFVEDQLNSISGSSNRIIAHPSSGAATLGLLAGPQTIVVGPEGGFIPYEIELFQKTGFKTVNLGPRILKSETAMVSLLSRIQIS